MGARRNRTRWATLVLPAALFLHCTTNEAPPQAPSTPPNIILVSIDSLRPANLGCYGYERNTSPFIDSLASAGTRFQNAISTTSWTLPSHAAMFTGLYDSAHGLVDNGQRLAESHVTLAELLRERGYHTAGFFGGPYLHPAFGISQGFDVYRSCMTALEDDADEEHVRKDAGSQESVSHRDVTGPRTREEVARWARQRPDGPFFLFLHLWDVHYDYIPPQEYVEMFDPGYRGPITGELYPGERVVNRGMDERDLRHLVARYDGEIRYTDDILEDMFQDLDELAMLENTLVIVTADHGEEFFEHGGKGHQRTLFDEVVRVPLIFHWPGKVADGVVVDQQVRLVDLLPTLASYVGFEIDRPVHGQSLVPLLSGGSLTEEPALSELLVNRRTTRALRTDRTKLLRRFEGSPGILFDLESDPGEHSPIEPGAEREAERRVLDESLQRMVAEAAALGELLRAGGETEIELDDELRERLESLGYID
jgi:arylsulfatase A-like enzyme